MTEVVAERRRVLGAADITVETAADALLEVDLTIDLRGEVEPRSERPRTTASSWVKRQKSLPLVLARHVWLLDASASLAAAIIAGLELPAGMLFAAMMTALVLARGPVRAPQMRLFKDLLQVVGHTGVSTLGVGLVLGAGLSAPTLWSTALWALFLAGGARGSTQWLARSLRRRGIGLEPTLIVGAGATGVAVAQMLHENKEFGLQPVGFLDSVFEEMLPLPVIGAPEDLAEVATLVGARHVVVAFGATRDAEIVHAIRGMGQRNFEIYVLERFFELGVSSDENVDLLGFPLVRVRRPAPEIPTWPMKRAFDIVFAFGSLVLAAPVLAICAIAIKLSSPGPVLFRQSRVGQWGDSFEILKLRTMRVNNDSDITWSVEYDSRITSVGKILRLSHLDELPQLVNVLRGEMSIIGPRPERPFFVDQFSDEISSYSDRHRVPVGITGWAQVHGFWGDTSIEDRTRMDNRYIENWSFWHDVTILFRTIPSLLGRRG